jgi:hypothetical protein
MEEQPHNKDGIHITTPTQSNEGGTSFEDSEESTRSMLLVDSDGGTRWMLPK